MLRKLTAATIVTFCLCASAEVPPPTVILQGVMVSNDNWTSASDAGIYNIDVRPGGAVTCQHHSEAMASIVAAINHNGTLYAVEADHSGIYYRQFSASTWASKGSREEIDVVNLPSDLTYDAATGKVYGGFWDENYAGFSRFASFGLGTAEATDIKGADRDERDIFAVAAAPDGTVYALFGAYNYLAVINTRNGALERIGTTGLDIDTNPSDGRVNSMCYDSANDRLLAVVHHETGPRGNKKHFSSLYSINPHTAETEVIMDFPGAACFAGLTVLSDKPSATAPAAVRNLTAGNGRIEFDVPSTCIGGAPLAGPLTAIINVNGNETLKEGLTPGSHVTVDNIPLLDGMNIVKVTVATEDERGESTSIEFRNGEDIPAPVSNLTLNIADGTAHLSWDAPQTGAGGGTINPDNLSYRIVRYPDNKTVAEKHPGTSFTDATISPEWKSVYYTVTAINAQGESTPVNSNRCPGSGALPLPFSEGFDTTDDFAAWTIVDLNGSATWKYDNSGKSAIYDFPRDATPGDDWLISPPLAFEAGKTYKISYDYRAFNSRYSESFEVAFLPQQNPDNASVLTTHSNFSHTSFKLGETVFKAETDSRSCIGFHAISKPNQWSFYIDNVRIEAIDARVPAEADNLCVTAAPRGAMKATVSFTTPTTDTDGTPLSELLRAEIRRTDSNILVADINNPKPGDKISVEDSNIPVSGTYTYTIVCVNSAGCSVAAQASAYIGIDAPGSVGSLNVTEKDNHPYLSWAAPAAGANGGWFDSTRLTYRIVRSDGSVIAESCSDLFFEDENYKTPKDTQDAIWYLVTPYCGDTKGAYAQSDLTLFGKPYSTPSFETFAGIDMVYYPWITQSWDYPTQNWTLDAAGYYPPCVDYTGDGGLATFHSVGEKEMTTSWYYSPMFDISELDAPELSFYMYHTPSIAGNASLEIFVSIGSGFEPLATVLRRDSGNNDGWQRHTVDLSPYKGAKWLRVAFKGTADGKADIYIDGIGLSSAKADDAAIISFTGPAKIGTGCSGTYNVGILNNGKNAITGATLTITDGSRTIFTKNGIDITEGETVTVSAPFEFISTGIHLLSATIAFPNDCDASNNTMSYEIKVVEAVVPRPVNLQVSASADGALLTWEEPSTEGSVTEDFESYADFAISGIGDWTMYDGDNAPTYYINMNSGGEYPNATAAKSFQLINCATLGIDIWEQGKAHSGNKLMAAMASIGYVNDDRLISPMLNGTGQWISFWARSFTTDGIAPERMKVLVSSTDTNPASFNAVSEQYIELDGIWRQFRYWMPEGSRYFAINCVSDNSFAMFVDDARFNDMTVPTWTPSGYEVLKNGIVIAKVATPGYVDTEAADGAVYTVRAIYGDKGTSDESDSAAYTASSVLQPATVDLQIEGIYTPAGAKIEGKPAHGIYIIRYNDGSARKTAF